MPNIINAEHSSSTGMVITLTSLANGVFRQSDMVNNLDDAQMIRIYFKITTGTSPTVNETLEFYLLTGNLGAIRTDNAGASDAIIIIETAPIVNVVQIDNTNDKTYRGSFLIRNPGPEWGIAVGNNSGASLNSTGSNHELAFITENVEVQD